MTSMAISSSIERLKPMAETTAIDTVAVNAIAVRFGEGLQLQGYRIGNGNERAVKAVSAYAGRKGWAIRENRPDAEPKKGLFLYGGTGAGKTYLMRLYCQRFPMTEFIRMDELAGMYATGGIARLDSWLDCHESDEIVIDDFGAETNCTYFGGQFPVLHVLEKRLISLERWGRVAHFTSNIMNSADLQKMYNPQITSRILGNCVFVGFGGTDRRLERC